MMLPQTLSALMSIGSIKERINYAAIDCCAQIMIHFVRKNSGTIAFTGGCGELVHMTAEHFLFLKVFSAFDVGTNARIRLLKLLLQAKSALV